jgi:hypothetical protein
VHGRARLFARRRVASRRVASRLELTVARYRSFEAALRRPHDNIDKLPAANSRQTERLVIDVVVGASLMTQTAENVDLAIRIFWRKYGRRKLAVAR